MMYTALALALFAAAAVTAVACVVAWVREDRALTAAAKAEDDANAAAWDRDMATWRVMQHYRIAVTAERRSDSWTGDAS